MRRTTHARASRNNGWRRECAAARCILYRVPRRLEREIDLQSSTPEEYLDGRVLAVEAGLRDRALAVERDGGLAPQAVVDYRGDGLLLLQRLLLVSVDRG